jgi:hypothetical protein
MALPADNIVRLHSKISKKAESSNEFDVRGKYIIKLSLTFLIILAPKLLAISDIMLIKTI